MRILCLDDEPLALKMLQLAVEKAKPEAEILTFSKQRELIAEAESGGCDVAFLDIHMRGMTGVEVAKTLKGINPKMNIIFVTGFSEYKGDAMDMKASGYIMKPVTAAEVKAELEDLRFPVIPRKNALLRVQCFGNFDVFTPDGSHVHFERSRSKEIFDGTHGGFIGVQSKNGGNITLEGCAFIGSLLGADTNNCGGFVGWRTKQITISDSIFAPESVTVSGTGSAVFARSTASVNNSYYFYALGEDSDNQGKQGYSVTAGENVTLALSGEETQYKVSGITACKNNSSLQYNGTCYAGEEDEVSLTLSHPDTPEGYIFSGYKASAGALNEGVLTMPAENVTISGGFEFADGVGTRLVGRSISVEGDVGVNFYMEIDPEIAATYLPSAVVTVPLSEAHAVRPAEPSPSAEARSLPQAEFKLWVSAAAQTAAAQILSFPAERSLLQAAITLQVSAAAQAANAQTSTFPAERSLPQEVYTARVSAAAQVADAQTSSFPAERSLPQAEKVPRVSAAAQAADAQTSSFPAERSLP